MQEKKIDRKHKTKMPEQSPQERVKNFNEVALGYTEEQALQEAERCLQCKKPTCIEGCPVEVDIPAFIKLIKERKFVESSLKIKEFNSLPAICGRVCPQETQCEEKCVLAKREEPAGIGRLERFVADYEYKVGVKVPLKAKPNGHKVAIIGSGPAGLTCAGDLAKLGYEVVVFEALHEFGGVLTYGIPEFRLPKEIVKKEVAYIESLGVKFEKNAVIGRIATVDELLKEYDAVFIGTGAGTPNFMNIEGENLNGIYSANEFLTRVNLMKAYKFPEYDTPVRFGKNVAVIGGGNVAMDSARSALRLGAEKVYLIYRRSEEEMSAKKEEVEHAKEEGIIFMLLTNPIKYIGDEKGNVQKIECIKMKLGEVEKDGRRKPIPIENSNFTIEVDVVIVAIGTSPNPLIRQTTIGLEVVKHGTIIADEDGRTKKVGVFAGGDIVTGSATVISAMGGGKRSARAIDKWIKEGKKSWDFKGEFKGKT